MKKVINRRVYCTSLCYRCKHRAYDVSEDGASLRCHCGLMRKSPWHGWLDPTTGEQIIPFTFQEGKANFRILEDETARSITTVTDNEEES